MIRNMWHKEMLPCVDFRTPKARIFLQRNKNVKYVGKKHGVKGPLGKKNKLL